jgi:CheY-like chemotaxis protein
VDRTAIHSTASSSAIYPLASAVSILIVDPDTDSRALYRQSFALAGCDVVEASDGREALAKVFTRVPTLIITEMRLPFVDGCALCEILRRDSVTVDVPILVVTADVRATELSRVRQLGADGVLVKPTTPEDVLTAARRLMAETGEMRQRAKAMRANAVTQRQQAERQRVRLSKSFSRFATTVPPVSPPILVCPSCDRALTYEQSYVGGVSMRHPEQWDHYTCPSGACGVFQYRHRTRKLRRVE